MMLRLLGLMAGLALALAPADGYTVLNSPHFALQGMDATPSASPQAFDADIRAEAPVLERLVRESGAKVD